MNLCRGSHVFVGGGIRAYGTVIAVLGQDVYRNHSGDAFLMPVFDVRLRDGTALLAFENALIDVTPLAAMASFPLQPGGCA